MEKKDKLEKENILKLRLREIEGACTPCRTGGVWAKPKAQHEDSGRDVVNDDIEVIFVQGK